MHPFFGKYKNAHENKAAYIIGSGPSLNNFTPIDAQGEDAIYIGGNNSHRMIHIQSKLSYLFFLFRGYNNYYNNASTVYGDYCDMIRKLPPKIQKFCCLNFHTSPTDPMINTIKEENPNVEFYQVTANPPIKQIDITKDKLWNFSIVFSMAMFALYTGVNKLYIVGCDCTEGYFFNQKYDGEHFHQYQDYIDRWKSFKIYVNTYYPDVEIISINPVGLTGMFKDVYTSNNHLVTYKKQIIANIPKTNDPMYLVNENSTDLIEKSIVKNGYWGKQFNSLCSNFITPNSTILDIGANLGGFCIDIANKLKTCHIIALEPQQTKFYQLCANIFINKLNNISAIMKATSNSDLPSLEFVIASDNNNGASRLKIEADESPVQIKEIVNVDIVKIDNLVTAANVSFIKIDVEGHELDTLKSGATLIKQQTPIIVLESWDDKQEKQQALFDYITNIMGYSIFKFEPNEYLLCHNDQNTIEFRDKLTNLLNHIYK
jgi:FkbM family methyltransferase